MYSAELLPPIGPESAGVMVGAITDVAERTFFALTTPCDGAAWQQAPAAGWVTATVRFDEGGVGGELSCLIPDALARDLFDAFNGRDPGDPEPAPGSIFDLAGEFANMICGAWLSRSAARQCFVLAPPDVRRLEEARSLEQPAGWRTTMMVNDLPLVVDVRLAPR